MALVEYDHEGSIAVITMNRPEKRNAITPEAQVEFNALLKKADADNAVRVVILTGAGGDFCVGGDFGAVETMLSDPAFRKELARMHSENAECLMMLSKPTIAAADGAAIGFGAELVAFCDLAVIGEDGFIADTHIKFGLPPAPGTTLLWPQLTSRKVASELLLTGRKVHAEEALRLGLVNRVAPRGKTLAIARELAQEIADLPEPGVRDAKSALRQSYYALLEAANTETWKPR